MDITRDALKYVAELGVSSEKTEVLEINGKTYANRSLHRYDTVPKADPISASSLTALVDYIRDCNTEFRSGMIIHIVSPTRVQLMSELDAEREREVLFASTAEVSKFRFDDWYDQERMMIELQANFAENGELALVLNAVGNIEKKNEQSYSDDGRSQVATMTVGVAQKADVIVPNPVELVPYRTFQEVDQPASKFVLRIGDRGEPQFKLVEAENGIWKNKAILNIKNFLSEKLSGMPEELQDKITIIG